MPLNIENPACGGLDALLEGFPLGIVVGDTERAILDCNPEAARILGLTCEDLMARGWRGPDWRFFRSDGSPMPPEERPATRAVAERRTVRNAEMGLMRPDGHIAWLSVTVSFLDEEKLVLTFTDLSDQHAGRALEARQVERVLRESEQRLATMFQLVPVALVVTDLASGLIIATNREFSHVTGWDESEVLGRTSVDIGLWGSAKDRSQVVDRLGQGGTIRDVEMCCPRKDGTPHWISLSVDLVEIQGKRCVLAAGVDVTGRRKAAEEREILEARMMRAEKMQSLGNLAGGVAHDMNNVLAATLGLACVSLQEAPQGQVRECLDTIVRASMLGRATVRRLLDFSRHELGEEAPLDLNLVVTDILKILERATLQRVCLEVDLASGLPRVLGDAAALPHAIMNLCVHAMDAMPTGGTLLIRTSRQGEGPVILEVRDSGGGISPEVLNRALEPYFITRPEGRSVGLGLPQVHGTVLAHRAEMEIDSVPGMGTSVTVRFPACPERAALPEAVASRAVEVERPLRVLLVDDDEILQFALRLQLTHLGHVTTVTSRGEEALASLEQGLDVDVVVLDLNMPGLGGARTLPALRSVRPDLPVLVISGRVDETTETLVQAHRPAVAMAKPFTLAELKESLAALVRE